MNHKKIKRKRSIQCIIDFTNLPYFMAKITPAILDAISPGQCYPLYFIGPLGAGKTTFVQQLFTVIGILEEVKSPTFALLSSYITHDLILLHTDCYRFQHPDDWLLLGVDSYLTEDKPCLWCIEWPELSKTLPKAWASFDLKRNKNTVVCTIDTASQALCDSVSEYQSLLSM